MDHAEKIMWLTKIIKSICEENNLNKNVVIEDFIYELKQSTSKSEFIGKVSRMQKGNL